MYKVGDRVKLKNSFIGGTNAHKIGIIEKVYNNETYDITVMNGAFEYVTSLWDRSEIEPAPITIKLPLLNDSTLLDWLDAQN